MANRRSEPGGEETLMITLAAHLALFFAVVMWRLVRED